MPYTKGAFFIAKIGFKCKLQTNLYILDIYYDYYKP